VADLERELEKEKQYNKLYAQRLVEEMKKEDEAS
jgi:hypothetical protein